MRWMLAAALSFLILPWWATPTAAHTDLVSVTPGDGDRPTSWPSEVVLVFTEPVDPSLSAVSVSVGREPGATIPLTRGAGDSELVGDLRSLEPLRHSPPHRVRVSYRVTSTDGHPIAGSSTFTVAPGGSASRSSSGEDTEAASPAPAPTEVTASGPGVGVWLVGGGLSLVLVSTVVSVRRMRARPSAAQEGRR